MSRTLFEQAAPRPVRRWRRLTVVTSIVLHAGVVAGLVALQFSDVGAPLISRRVQAFMLPSAPPLPPPVPRATPPPSATTPDVNRDAAPLTASEHPADSPPVVASNDAPSMSGLVGDPRGVPYSTGVSTNLPTPPPLPPQTQAPIRISTGITPPTRLAYVPPVYPPIAQTAHVEGTVILECTIDERGNVRDAKVLRSIPMLDRAALDAVLKWRYTPTRLSGMAVPVIMTVTVTFSLR